MEFKTLKLKVLNMWEKKQILSKVNKYAYTYVGPKPMKKGKVQKRKLILVVAWVRRKDPFVGQVGVIEKTGSHRPFSHPFAEEAV